MTDGPEKKINFKVIILLVLLSLSVLSLCLYAIHKIEPDYKPVNIESLTNFQKQDSKNDESLD